MGMVVCFVKIHIRPYMDDIFTLIRVSSLTASTHPHKAPKHRSLTHFYFPVSQKTALNLWIALSCGGHFPH